YYLMCSVAVWNELDSITIYTFNVVDVCYFPAEFTIQKSRDNKIVLAKKIINFYWRNYFAVNHSSNAVVFWNFLECERLIGERKSDPFHISSVHMPQGNTLFRSVRPAANI